jgi:hypothetical protein
MSGTAPGDASAPTSLECELLMSQHTRGDHRTVEEQPRRALASTAGRDDFRELAAEPSRSRFHIATGILAAARRVSECAAGGALGPSPTTALRSALFFPPGRALRDAAPGQSKLHGAGKGGLANTAVPDAAAPTEGRVKGDRRWSSEAVVKASLPVACGRAHRTAARDCRLSCKRCSRFRRWQDAGRRPARMSPPDTRMRRRPRTGRGRRRWHRVVVRGWC